MLRGLVIVSAATLLAACGGSGGDGGGTPLTVYVNAPFTGAPYIGETIAQGAELGLASSTPAA